MNALPFHQEVVRAALADDRASLSRRLAWEAHDLLLAESEDVLRQMATTLLRTIAAEALWKNSRPPPTSSIHPRVLVFLDEDDVGRLSVVSSSWRTFVDDAPKSRIGDIRNALLLARDALFPFIDQRLKIRRTGPRKRGVLARAVAEAKISDAFAYNVFLYAS